MVAGKLGSYYTGAYKLYQLRVGANDTDKNALDLVLRCASANARPGRARARARARALSLSLVPVACSSLCHAFRWHKDNPKARPWACVDMRIQAHAAS